MKYKSLSLMLGALMVSSASFAGPLKTSIVQLGGGTLGPRQSLTIPVTKLVPGAAYAVTCKINDPNNQKNKAILLIESRINDDKFHYSKISLNGQFLNSDVAQAKLPQVNNLIEIDYQYSDGDLSFTNLDQDDTITISDCVANPAFDNQDDQSSSRKK